MAELRAFHMAATTLKMADIRACYMANNRVVMGDAKAFYSGHVKFKLNMADSLRELWVAAT